MPIKLLVVSKAEHTNQILENLSSRTNSSIETVLHFGGKDSDFRATNIVQLREYPGKAGHIMDDCSYKGYARQLTDSKDFLSFRELFMEQMQRASGVYGKKNDRIDTFHDYYDYTHIVLDAVAQKIKESGATHCLFFNIPHLAFDCVIYYAAKCLGLKILILTQSILPNKYFSMKEPEALGNFSSSIKAPSFPIEQGKNLELFYMKNIKQEKEKPGKIPQSAYYQLAKFLFRKRPLSALNPFYLWRTLHNMRRIYGNFPKWRDPFARVFNEHELKYFDHLARFENKDFDINEEFVYFPLQLQPEMTTSALGGRFVDQAYALECLSGMLPKNVKIYVKENPKQGSYMRGPAFFHRLNRIPSLHILPSWADTYALTKHCKFVATITGTVGWEAIRSGKPALVFGKAWYRKLPGVYQFDDNPSYEEIIETHINHEDLEAETGKLVSAAHDGIIDSYYKDSLQEFDQKANTKAIAQTLEKLLNEEKKTSFGTPNISWIF